MKPPDMAVPDASGPIRLKNCDFCAVFRLRAGYCSVNATTVQPSGQKPLILQYVRGLKAQRLLASNPILWLGKLPFAAYLVTVQQVTVYSEKILGYLRRVSLYHLSYCIAGAWLRSAAASQLC